MTGKEKPLKMATASKPMIRVGNILFEVPNQIDDPKSENQNPNLGSRHEEQTLKQSKIQIPASWLWTLEPPNLLIHLMPEGFQFSQRGKQDTVVSQSEKSELISDKWGSKPGVMKTKL